MTIREISVLDADFIASAIELGFTDGWNKNMVLSAFDGGRFIGFIANNDGNDIGFITASLSFDTADIESVFVTPDNRKNGVAKELLNKIEEKITANGKNVILLEVKENNLPAINLYKALGYKNISIRKKYYADGSNAIVMQKEI